MPGYSGKPLAVKLGFIPPLRVFVSNAPPEYKSWLGDLPAEVQFVTRKPKGLIAAAHIFCTDREALDQHLRSLRHQLEPAGCVWVSWPKQSSGVATRVNEHTIRELALPRGFVDVKVCAVSDIWSGLKLVIRKTERG